MTNIFRLLRQHAKGWWYFKDLRSRGRHEEARAKEHKSTRSLIGQLRETIKNSGYLSIGRGGWTLHIDDGHTLSHYGGIAADIPQACNLLNIPIIDSTTIGDDLIVQTLSIPLVGIKRTDQAPFHSMAYAPLKQVAQRYKNLGATVYNLSLQNIILEVKT